MIPKTGYDESTKSYYVTVTVCLVIPKPTSIEIYIATNLTDVPVLPIQKVSIKVIKKEHHSTEMSISPEYFRDHYHK